MYSCLLYIICQRVRPRFSANCPPSRRPLIALYFFLRKVNRRRHWRTKYSRLKAQRRPRCHAVTTRWPGHECQSTISEAREWRRPDACMVHTASLRFLLEMDDLYGTAALDATTIIWQQGGRFRTYGDNYGGFTSRMPCVQGSTVHAGQFVHNFPSTKVQFSLGGGRRSIIQRHRQMPCLYIYIFGSEALYPR